MQSGAVLSRGYNFCTALETALKLTETCSLGVRGYSAADFMHGPIAAIHDGEPCFIIAPPGKAYIMMLEVAHKLKSHGAESIIISSEDDILNEAVIPIKLNVDVPEELSPLVYIIPGQLFACHLSMIRGYNPDKPAGLNKVTQTR